MSGEAGKGDTYRPVNKKIWDKNYEEALNDHREPEDFQKCKTTKNDKEKEKNQNGSITFKYYLLHSLIFLFFLHKKKSFYY